MTLPGEQDPFSFVLSDPLDVGTGAGRVALELQRRGHRLDGTGWRTRRILQVERQYAAVLEKEPRAG